MTWDWKQLRPKTRLSGRISIIFTVWLLFIWMAAMQSFTLLSVIGGLVIALAIQWFFPLPHQSGTWRIRLWPLVVLVTKFLWDLFRAGIHVARLVLFPHRRDDAIIACDIRTTNPVYVSILAAMTSLIPGTIVVQVDRPNHRIYLHVLDLQFQGGREGVREATKNQETRILRALAPKRVLEETGVTQHARD